MTSSIKLYDFQKEGIKWLASRNLALLADDMGLGKTVQVIKAADLIKAKRLIVVCPAIARGHWDEEIKKYSDFGRKVRVHFSYKDTLKKNESCITSYSLSNIKKHTGHIDLLILDEVHLLKSIDSMRSAKILGRNGLIRKAKKIWTMSGTPAPNHPAELWPILFAFGVTKLTHADFVRKYCNFYMFKGRMQVTGAKLHKIPELRELLKIIMLRRTKSMVKLELPSITFKDVVIPANAVDFVANPTFCEWTTPDDRTGELMAEINSQQKLIMDALTRTGFNSIDCMRALEALSSSVSTLRRYTGLQKVDACAEMIMNELNSHQYKKIVIFAIHRDVIRNLQVKLADFKPLALYGNMTAQTKQQKIDKFKKLKRHKVFIGNIQACGTAIDLTVAHNAIFIEQDWVPGNNAQAAMRLHRITQKMPVFIRVLQIENSMDQKIGQTLRRKTKELTLLFDNKNQTIADEFDIIKKDLPPIVGGDTDIFS